MNAKVTVIGALVWAVGFLASALALKGNPVVDWIEGALLAGWFVFVSLAARRERKFGAEQPLANT